MSEAVQKLNLSTTLELRRGGRLVRPTIAYETWGTLNPARDNGVLLFTGLSPSAHAASSPGDPAPGWWESMIGTGRPIDTSRYFVICLNSLGSCFGSTGPASNDPETGQPYRLSFPALTLEDVAAGGYELIRHLGIESLAVTIGPSMGGMTALAFVLQYPQLSRSVALISSAPHSLPLSIALRSLQRELIRDDPAWENGNYRLGGGPVAGMRLARKLGMMTYRSAEEWIERFGRERISAERRSEEPFAIEFEVESYLASHADRFIGQYDANCYLYLSRASDWFDAAEHGGSLQQGLDRAGGDRFLIVGVESDFLFPLHQQQALADGLARAGRTVDFRPLASVQGHDSFLVDMARFEPVIAEFFAGG